MVDDTFDDLTSGFGLRFEAIDEDVQDPLAGRSVRLDSRWVEDFRGDVTAEETPCGAVRGGADVMLVPI